jgi:hypothetical protein
MPYGYGAVQTAGYHPGYYSYPPTAYGYPPAYAPGYYPGYNYPAPAMGYYPPTPAYQTPAYWYGGAQN